MLSETFPQGESWLLVEEYFEFEYYLINVTVTCRSLMIHGDQYGSVLTCYQWEKMLLFTRLISVASEIVLNWTVYLHIIQWCYPAETLHQGHLKKKKNNYWLLKKRSRWTVYYIKIPGTKCQAPSMACNLNVFFNPDVNFEAHQKYQQNCL